MYGWYLNRMGGERKNRKRVGKRRGQLNLNMFEEKKKQRAPSMTVNGCV
jgi:hypothetical protein